MEAPRTLPWSLDLASLRWMERADIPPPHGGASCETTANLRPPDQCIDFINACNPYTIECTPITSSAYRTLREGASRRDWHMDCDPPHREIDGMGTHPDYQVPGIAA
jgi:hypothetical protein